MRKLLVSPILFYIKFWAKIALIIHKPTTIGIAGSVGKSSTRNALFAILKDQAKTKMISGNSETGIPLGILNLNLINYSIFEWLNIIISCPFKIFSTSKYKYLIIEMGIDDPYPPKNMDYLLSIIKPDISLSLNIAATHTLQFEKLLKDKSESESKFEFLLRKIAEEDTKIISKSGCRVGIYNSDDKYITQALSDFKGKFLQFGREDSDATYGKYEISAKGTTFEILIDNKKSTVKFEGQALPEVYQQLFAAVLLTAKYLGIEPQNAIESLEKNFSLPRGRSSIFKGKNHSVIIDSTYNSSKISVIAFLDLLKSLASEPSQKKVFIMGDMRELGNEAEKEHKEVAKKINEIADILYCIGPLCEKFVIPNVKGEIEKRWFSDAKRAGEYIEKNIPENSVILVKGSQNEIYLEETIKFLLADSADSKKLCRQSSFWMKTKNEFFNNF